jgi:isopentenyl diphosphate isomerase/L-lactate dehydrogenase-like FMN-dependent dehydrogenase
MHEGIMPEIVEALGNKMYLLFDAGIRTGVDIIKALALGILVRSMAP